jgi:hypothetical protein
MAATDVLGRDVDPRTNSTDRASETPPKNFLKKVLKSGSSHADTPVQQRVGPAASKRNAATLSECSDTWCHDG